MAFTATIPTTQNNPFISTTSLPEGTLFIVVGSILLGLFLIILAWRIWAIWAAHRAATYNDARFAALEPAYGGPFVDPVLTVDEADADGAEGGEKSPSKPRLHPIGVPLNVLSKTKARRAQANKTPAARLKEAQLQNRFYSPTTDVLTHGGNAGSTPMGPPSGPPLVSGSYLPSGYYSQPQSSRLSIMHTGRNSFMQQQAMSSSADLTNTDAASSRLSLQQPQQTKQKRIRPPSAYLDDLIG